MGPSSSLIREKSKNSPPALRTQLPSARNPLESLPQIVARILADNLQPPLKPVRGNKFAEGSIFPISSGERCGVEESVDLCPAVNSYDFGRTHRYSHPFCLSFLLSERKFPAIDVCPSFFCSLSLSLLFFCSKEAVHANARVIAGGLIRFAWLTG